MKLVLVLDGERREVDVNTAGSVVSVGGHDWPFRLVASEEGAVTFELLGERVEARVDPTSIGKADRSVVVNGEMHSLLVESMGRPGARTPPSRPPPPSRPMDRPSGAEEGPGRTIFPPMPGRVLEVRVHDGDHVQPGQVLLVLEAMKMRNEVTAPVAGAIADLRVTPGANVAAKDVLLRVVPV